MTNNQTTNLSARELLIYIVKAIAVTMPVIAFAVIFYALLLLPHAKGFHTSLGNSLALLLLGLLSIVGEIFAVDYAYQKIFRTGFSVSNLM